MIVAVDSAMGFNAFRLAFTSSRPGFSFSPIRLERIVVAAAVAAFAGEPVLLGEVTLLGENGFRGERGCERYGF